MSVSLYKSQMNIGGKNKTVVIANYKQDEAAKQITQRHNILIFDRSGSMSGSLSRLIANMKKVIDYIPENDYITILWFSGEGQYKTIVKGAKKSEDLKRLLDNVNHTVGCTCFSEVLKEAADIINELKILCGNFIVNMFTDGEAVVNWGDREEYDRAKKVVSGFSADILAFNSVGYGNYYNQQFLKDLAEMTQYGVMVHSNKIEEYYDIITENFDRVKELTIGKLEVVANGAEILYVSSKHTKLAEASTKLSLLDKNKNQLVMISDHDFEFEINDAKFNSVDIKKSITKAMTAPVMYAYAYEKYYSGDRETSLLVLAHTLKDKLLVDEQFKAFTFDESSAYSKLLKKAVFNSKARLTGGTCSDNYIPADDATCLMDVLKVLINGDSRYVYSDNYTRIGLETVDTLKKFNKSESVPMTSLSDVVFNATKLNASIMSTIYGTVKLTAAEAKKCGTGKIINSRIYRNQTLVKDGNLNMDRILIVLDESTLKQLKDLGIDGLISSAAKREAEVLKSLTVEEAKTAKVIEIDLTKVPVINRMYLEGTGSIDKVLENTIKVNELAVKQKALNFFKKQVNATGFTDEQLEVLKKNGLNGRLEYTGIQEKKDKVAEDYYIAREIGFDIKGSTTIPSIAEVIKKAGSVKALTGNSLIMWDYIQKLEKDFNSLIKKESKKPTSKTMAAALSKKLQDGEVTKIKLLECDVAEVPGLYEFLEKELKKVKLEKLACSIEESSVKIAKVLTGSWFEGLVEDGKGGYSYSKDGHTLMIKTKKVQVFY